MKQFNEYQVSVRFFPKKRSKKKDVKTATIYATISYRGTSTKLSTGLVCDEPEKQWESGGFVGRNFQDLNDQLAEIRREIKNINSSPFRDAEEIKRAYLGEDEEKIFMTVISALEFGYQQKSYDVKAATLRSHRSSIVKFEKYLSTTPIKDWSLLRDHPSSMTKLRVQKFYNWMLDNGARTSANSVIGCLAALYKVYYDIHQDQNANLVPNLFTGMQKQGDKQDRIDKAIARAIDWKYVEEIDIVRNKITSYKIDENSPLGYREMDEEEYIRTRSTFESFEERKERYRIYGLLTMFMANTGLSWVEFGKANVFEAKITMQGAILSDRRVKTRMLYRIPVSPIVKKLIKELEGNLPWKPYVASNSVYDISEKSVAYMAYFKYLKVLRKVIGSKEKLRPHGFRHAFAMRMLNHYGLSIQTVAEMLGDSVKTVADNYARNLDQTVQEKYNEEIARHQEKLENMKKKSKGKKKKNKE
jgi:integrase